MKLDKPSLPSMLAAAPPPPAAAAAPPEVDDDEGPMVWYHEGPPELTTARYWIADYSISKYGVAARVSLILIVFFLSCFRAQARLQKAREEAQKPGPEKAARIQNLHKKLRV